MTWKKSMLLLSLLFVSLLFTACDDSDSESTTDDDDDDQVDQWDGVCSEETENFEKCEDNRIQWCHVLEGMDPHFHEGLNCESLGLTCMEHAENAGTDQLRYVAYCVDESITCEEGEYACAENTAQNCLDGVMAMEPCGTGTCHEHDGEALCEDADDEECNGHGHLHDDACECDEGYEQDPDDPASCVSELSFPELACELYNNNKDAIEDDHKLDATDSKPGPHAHLDEVMQVQLLSANASNYVHFPMLESGEYVLFADVAGVLKAFYDKDGNELPFTNPGPNGMCESDLVDHFHISGTYTGDGESPQPIIAEAQVDQDTTLRFLVMLHEEEEEDHDHE